MIDFFPLAIFPHGSLAESVITSVWVGVCISALLNLRFGWTFSGLIVPGYLVPLILIKPWAAVVIIIEAMVAYLIVRIISDWVPRFGVWSSFFGRDRFFAILLFSVFVRIGFDGFLLPSLGRFVNSFFALDFDYRNDLHSFGLIVVALLANQFWKPGLVRGAGPFFCTLGLTFIVVRYGLIEFTNFNVGSLEYLYEGIATSFLASPKAYIVILTTAAIASRMNLRYSWELSGIMVPSLLALQWYQPSKILATIIEVIAVYLLAALALRLPGLRGMTIEGARQLLLFFNISFVYRMIVGYLAVWFLPQAQVSDFFGFGYLLVTMLAIKAHDKGILVKLSRATLQVSLIGAVTAGIVGFGLRFAPDLGLAPPVAPIAEQEAASITFDGSLAQVLADYDLAIQGARTTNSFVRPLGYELDSFARGLEVLLKSDTSHQDELMSEAHIELKRAGYSVNLVEGRFLVLSEAATPRGWGLYILDRQNPRSLIVEVPAPLDEPGTLRAGYGVFKQLSGSALAIAGSAHNTNPDGTADVLDRSQTIFHTFHRTVDRNNVLQVRRFGQRARRAVLGRRQMDETLAEKTSPNILLVKNKFPPGLDLASLQKLIGTCDIRWGRNELRNIQRDVSWDGFGELFLELDELRRVAVIASVGEPGNAASIAVERSSARLWLERSMSESAARGSESFVRPTRLEMLYFDSEILSPLLVLLNTLDNDLEVDQLTTMPELNDLALKVASFGFGFTCIVDSDSGKPLLALHEVSGKNRRHWATGLFRLGNSAPYFIEVPRPLAERGTLEASVALFHSLGARALIVSGAHPNANADGSADVVAWGNQVTLFNLLNQVLLRESENGAAILVRGMGKKTATELEPGAALLAVADGTVERRLLSPLLTGLTDGIEKLGLVPVLVDGSAISAGYETTTAVQSRYLDQTRGKDFAIIWLAPESRRRFNGLRDDSLIEAQMTAIGSIISTGDLVTFLEQRLTGGFLPELPPELRNLLQRWVLTRDIISLEAAAKDWSAWRLELLHDQHNGQSYLVVMLSTSKGAYVKALNSDVDPSFEPTHCGVGDAACIGSFVRSFGNWLAVGEEQ